MWQINLSSFKFYNFNYFNYWEVVSPLRNSAFIGEILQGGFLAKFHLKHIFIDEKKCFWTFSPVEIFLNQYIFAILMLKSWYLAKKTMYIFFSNKRWISEEWMTYSELLYLLPAGPVSVCCVTWLALCSFFSWPRLASQSERRKGTVSQSQTSIRVTWPQPANHRPAFISVLFVCCG